MKPEGLLALAPGCLNPGFVVRRTSKLWRSFVASAPFSPRPPRHLQRRDRVWSV